MRIVTTTDTAPALRAWHVETWLGRPAVLAAALAIALVTAALLRLPGIAAAPLWADEIASWTFATRPWPDLLGPLSRVEPNPPGHYALLKAWIGVAGDSAAALRLPSVVAGTLTVLPLALVAMRLGGKLAGTVTALLVTFSAELIHYAQQARGYALLVLAASIALWLLGPLLRAAQRPSRRAAATLGFVLACLVMLHLHATATLTVAALFGQAAAILGLRWHWGERPARGAVLALLAAGLLVALGAAWWLSRAIGIAADPMSAASWIERPSLGATGAILADLAGGFHLGRLKLLAGAAMGATLLAGVVLAVRHRQAEALGLAVGFALNLLALHGLSQVKPMLLERTALVLLAFALPLAGYAVAVLRPRALGLGLCALLLALGLRGALTRAAEFSAHGFGEDWRGALATLAQRAAPGDMLVFLNPLDLGALPYHAPALMPRLTIRTLIPRRERLLSELAARAEFARELRPGEGCGTPAWTLARETQWERPVIAGWPPPELTLHFGEVVLRRRPLPC
jgi:mannosyltransferase